MAFELSVHEHSYELIVCQGLAYVQFCNSFRFNVKSGQIENAPSMTLEHFLGTSAIWRYDDSIKTAENETSEINAYMSLLYD